MERTDIYWRGHRVGSRKANSASIITIGSVGSAAIPVLVTRVNIPAHFSILTISKLTIEFDPAFAELRGITGVEIEPTETEEVKAQVAKWLEERG